MINAESCDRLYLDLARRMQLSVPKVAHERMSEQMRSEAQTTRQSIPVQVDDFVGP